MMGISHAVNLVDPICRSTIE